MSGVRKFVVRPFDRLAARPDGRSLLRDLRV